MALSTGSPFKRLRYLTEEREITFFLYTNGESIGM